MLYESFKIIIKKIINIKIIYKSLVWCRTRIIILASLDRYTSRVLKMEKKSQSLRIIFCHVIYVLVKLDMLYKPLMKFFFWAHKLIIIHTYFPVSYLSDKWLIWIFQVMNTPETAVITITQEVGDSESHYQTTANRLTDRME